MLIPYDQVTDGDGHVNKVITNRGWCFMFIKYFDSTADSLMALLNSIKNCTMQLPDFQRGWVWDDERIRKLLVSISQSHPIGAVMTLETGGPNVNFLTRPVEGVENPQNINPDKLILDGQQRLTSLFQSLMIKKPVKTRDMRGYEIERYYYIKINSIIDPNADNDEAIISVPGTRIVKGLGNVILADYSDTHKECLNDLFPVNLIFDSVNTFQWQMIYTENGTNMDKMQKWLKFNEYIIRFQQYQVPVISLSNKNTKEAVCSVFENVNTGGVPLTVFELLTAIYAADNFQLRQDWADKDKNLKDNAFMHSKILRDITSVELLQTICLLSTYHSGRAVSCKRKDVLSLELPNYKLWADKVIDGMKEVAIFLQEQYVFTTRDLPYGSQIVPLTAIFTELGKDAKVLANRQKIARWYWCGVFGELYGGANETRFAKDYVEVVKWIRDTNADDPSTIVDSNFTAQRLLSLRTRNSAAYKGINVLLLKNGARDFNSGLPLDIQNYYNMAIDIHHIFPKAYCEKAGIDYRLVDSIVNKAPLSYDTNRSIGGRKPSDYLATLDRKNNQINTDNLLVSQCIDPAAIRSNDFNLFFDKRKQELISLIEGVTGKKVV